MSINVSECESYEFGKHFGKTKQDFLSNGDGLSSSSVSNGIVRGFSDNIVISSSLQYPDTVFGWISSEDCLILSGGVRITRYVTDNIPIVVGLFTGITWNDDLIEELGPWIPTNTVDSYQLLTNDQPHFAEKGTAIGFTTPGGTVDPRVELSYYLTYMSDL